MLQTIPHRSQCIHIQGREDSRRVRPSFQGLPRPLHKLARPLPLLGRERLSLPLPELVQRGLLPAGGALRAVATRPRWMLEAASRSMAARRIPSTIPAGSCFRLPSCSAHLGRQAAGRSARLGRLLLLKQPAHRGIQGCVRVCLSMRRLHCGKRSRGCVLCPSRTRGSPPLRCGCGLVHFLAALGGDPYGAMGELTTVSLRF